ncbi:hypothetical protein OHB54_18885 [Streptomyces sp. NBC_01007]|nr:hypothetical protein OHB54_18885 [Streptomyces sp. NBC_01007]
MASSTVAGASASDAPRPVAVTPAHAAEKLRDTVMDQFPPDAEEGLFVATARKAAPFSALAYALGPDATLRLPGRFGDFLLDAEQARAQLPAVEEGRGDPRPDRNPTS